LKDAIPEAIASFLFDKTSLRYQRPLMFAPIFAAIACVTGIRLERADIYNIRRLEEFDPHWFRSAHSYAHTCLCASMRPGKNT